MIFASASGVRGVATSRRRKHGDMEIALLRSLAAAALLAAALLLDFVAHRRWFRRRQSLAGRVVLITGAAGGLGRQLALRFACA